MTRRELGVPWLRLDRVCGEEGGRRNVAMVRGDPPWQEESVGKKGKKHTVSFNFRYRCGFLFPRCYARVQQCLAETVRQRTPKRERYIKHIYVRVCVYVYVYGTGKGSKNPGDDWRGRVNNGDRIS